MGAFDFSKAEVDPWAQLDQGQMYYVVVIRTTQGQGVLSLVTSATKDGATLQALAKLQIDVAAHIKDVRSIALHELEVYSPREIQKMLNKILGVSNEIS